MKNVLLSVQRDEEQRTKHMKYSKEKEAIYIDKNVKSKFYQVSDLLDMEKKYIIADIKESCNAKIIARLQDESLNISGKAIGSISRLAGRIGCKNSNIIASPAAVALVHRQIESLGLHMLQTKISDDNVCSQISVSSFFSLFVKTQLRPKNWDPSVPFQMVYHIDGTRKHLQNIIAAGLKIAKKKNQNHIFFSNPHDDLDSTKLHSTENGILH
jgi:hypothetical protein